MTQTTIGIDPGNKRSAWMMLSDAGNPWRFGLDDNDVLLESIRTSKLSGTLAIEYMKPRGMPTSQEEMDTQFFAGRLVQAWGKPWAKVYRMDVKLHLCGQTRAKDSNIRQALLDRFPATGGGKTPQVGTKKQPGPLYGVSNDIWSALAIATTFRERGASE